MKKLEPIYTHEESANIVELFENILDQNGIKIPSPEDDEREPDNAACLYGSTYSDLLDEIEYSLVDMLNRQRDGAKVIADEFP